MTAAPTRLFFLNYDRRRCLSAVYYRGFWDVSHLGKMGDIDFVTPENGWFRVNRGEFESRRIDWER